MIADVEAKKIALRDAKKAIKVPWKTSCSYSFDSSGKNASSIQTMTETEVINVAADVSARCAWNVIAQARLNVAAKEPLICGYVEEDWIADCQKRIAIIQYTEKSKALDAIMNRLDPLLSTEQKRQMELDNIAEELNLI